MDYYLNQHGEYVIENYDFKKSFTSFLPGVAGMKGIPIWAFYVNRGQGISSFGIEDKNSPILEFFPANTAYQYVDRYGFRTIIRLADGTIYEPFAARSESDESKKIKRSMRIRKSDFTIVEDNDLLGMVIEVTYFGLPQMNMGALVREVKIMAKKDYLKFDILDGVAAILPSGVTTNSYKEMSNLIRSWMEVENLDEHLPFFTLRASTADEAEVSEFEKGHFYLSFVNDKEIILPIVDPRLIFGQNTALTYPDAFHELDINHIGPQVTVNQVPCAFTPVAMSLTPGEPQIIHTVIGHVEDIELIRKAKNQLASHDFLFAKKQEAFDLIEEVVSDIETKTSNPLFDAYMKHCYFDNMLRGGYPITLKGNTKAYNYYVYSRKHGDPEREYNFFVLSPEYYSNGEGNFRDINQNRRSDVYFKKEAGLYNIKLFFQLIQLDGYNPLVVKGSEFVLANKEKAKDIIEKHFVSSNQKLVEKLGGKFTPGKILTLVENNQMIYKTSEEAFMAELVDESEQTFEARHGEGFWSDHFTYNMDLIDSYLQIYPDKLKELMLLDETYRYFDSIERVVSRRDKTVLNKKNQVRQYGAAVKDHEAIKKNQLDPNSTNWVKKSDGTYLETNLLVKLLSLGLNKVTLLDPEGMGIQMEGNKPGWNDAMNGLPGLFGSGLGETFEVLRIYDCLKKGVEAIQDVEFALPVEILELLLGVSQVLTQYKDQPFKRWQLIGDLRETYREKIRFGVIGQNKSISRQTLLDSINTTLDILNAGIKKSEAYGENGIYPTFFTFEATDYQVIKSDGQVVLTHYGLPAVEVNAFKCSPLPLFLEGPARALKVEKDTAKALVLHEKVKQSQLFDRPLKMYKTSVPLNDASFEIGRIKAFTPGWLERESIFLHMTYKYLWGLLASGCYDAFFEEMATNFTPYMNPEVYGRNVLENSSFIASSVNPDSRTHGQGFVARLSGSNAEVLSIWYKLMVGETGFVYENELSFTFAPILPNSFFDQSNEVAFKLLNHTWIQYINPTGKDTFGKDKAKVSKLVCMIDGEAQIIEGDTLNSTFANKLREGGISSIKVYFE